MKHKFTLVELLLVTAIVTILAGLLLPALKTARQKAKAISCMNNLKQTSVAFMHYGGDYNDLYPYRPLKGVDQLYPSWSNCLIENGYINEGNFLVCPARKDYEYNGDSYCTYGMVKPNFGRTPESENPAIWSDYKGIRVATLLNLKTVPAWFIKRGLSGSLSEFIFLGDTAWSTESRNYGKRFQAYYFEIYRAFEGGLTTVHGGNRFVNSAFGDGHVEPASPQALANSQIEWYLNEHGVRMKNY